jgi:hypothetical protein
MLRGQTFEDDDIQALAQILESERQSACRKRALCFGLFAFWFVLLVGALGVIGYLIVTRGGEDGLVGQTLGVAQILAILSAAVVTFFTMGWAAQNCINSIERSLVAARHGRRQLFAGFLEQLQCADKEKRKLWLEVIKAAAA